MDYSFTVNQPTSVDPGQVAAALVSLGALWLITMAICVFMIVCWYKIFRKMGFKGWYALCPVLDSYTICKGVWGDGFVFLLQWIPFYGIYVAIKTVIGLGRSFGKGVGFGLGLLFLSPIFLGILAFGKSEYIGVPYPDEFA